MPLTTPDYPGLPTMCYALLWAAQRQPDRWARGGNPPRRPPGLNLLADARASAAVLVAVRADSQGGISKGDAGGTANLACGRLTAPRISRPFVWCRRRYVCGIPALIAEMPPLNTGVDGMAATNHSLNGPLAWRLHLR